MSKFIEPMSAERASAFDLKEQEEIIEEASNYDDDLPLFDCATMLIAYAKRLKIERDEATVVATHLCEVSKIKEPEPCER